MFLRELAPIVGLSREQKYHRLVRAAFLLSLLEQCKVGVAAAIDF